VGKRSRPSQHEVPPRFRSLYPELASRLSEFKPGRLNAITDVSGVRVGHATVLNARKGLMSGVTAIWPRTDVYSFRPRASGHVLHGAGEMTGLHQVLEWGMIETPILLTSTLNVGRVYDAAIEYLAGKHPRMGISEDVLIPIVGECDDSHMSRARLRPVGKREVVRALDGATAGAAVAEGSVGAGTGMISFDFKGGIGTSSRVVRIGEGARAKAYKVGVLLNANVGVRRQLRVAGIPIGRELRDRLMPESHPERSVIVIVSTDAPLRPDQLRRLCVRAGLGLGRLGSFAGHASGEIILGFSTTLGEPRDGPTARAPITQVQNLRDSFLNPFYEATVECVEESLLNALVASSVEAGALEGGAFSGRDGHLVHGLPLAALRERLG
jgi:D-aminopeptidase